MERLAQMVLSLEARLTTQERHQEIGQPTRCIDYPPPIKHEGTPGPVAGPFVIVPHPDSNQVEIPEHEPLPRDEVHDAKEIRVDRKPQEIAQ